MTNRYLFFPGCKIADHLSQYGTSTQAVFSALGIGLEEAKFNCCGYPVRHQDEDAFILSSARNLAIADDKGMDMITPCKCCFGSLRHAVFRLTNDPELKQRINDLLAPEGLNWSGRANIYHILQVFHDMEDMGRIKSRVSSPLTGVKVAAHYGCHALRPSDVVRFDNPAAPTIFENLILALGAIPVQWPMRLECCGYPLWEKNNRLSLAMMKKKVMDAKASGADLICTACTYCQMMFDTVRSIHGKENLDKQPFPSVLYTQLLGMALGLDEKSLGLEKNRIPPAKIFKGENQ